MLDYLTAGTHFQNKHGDCTQHCQPNYWQFEKIFDPVASV